MHSLVRSNSQHEIHECSSIEAAARATQHQRNGISPTAPWRFVRDPVKLLLPSLCSRRALYALVVTSALPRRLYNLWIAQPRRIWRFSCVSSALMLRSWRLNYPHDYCYCRSGYKKAALPLLSSLFACAQNASQLSILTFQDANPSKADGKIQARTCAGDYCHPAWIAGRGIPSSCPPGSCSSSWARPAPSRMSKLEPPACRQPRTDPEPFGPPPPGLVLLIQPGQSLGHNCQLHHSHWNDSVVHLVRRLVVSYCWTWISRRVK